MVEPSLLTEQEVRVCVCILCVCVCEAGLVCYIQVCWLDAYHQRVLREVGGYLQECGKTEVLQWLRQQTPPLA